MRWRAKADPLTVFEPDDSHEAVQGWALHATRRRKIHEAEARHLDRLRNTVGTIGVSLAAVAGTSAFAGWQSDSENTTLAIVTAVVGIGAAVLGSATTFLDFGGRAEAHRRAATEYKGVLREFEEISALTPESERFRDRKTLETMKTLLADADRAAPTVPEGRGKDIERLHFSFEGEADKLSPNAP